MAVFLLHHEHEPHECAAVFAAWTGFYSPVESSCLTDGHAPRWRVQAPDRASTLAQLPGYVVARTTTNEFREIHVP